MKILLATHNQAKLERYGKILKSVPDLEVVSLSDLKITQKVEEDCETNIENALKKARTYGKISGLITVAVDESLMTNFLPESEQPGVYARRLAKGGKELTDAQLLETWKEIFKKYPQEDRQFIFNYALAYFNPENNAEGVECAEGRGYVMDHFSEVETNGYPSSNFLSLTKGGLSYAEMDEKEREEHNFLIFADFVEKFKKWLGENSLELL
jgi:inosine/xanthosine triphosphate pyrophosphatase family protein